MKKLYNSLTDRMRAKWPYRIRPLLFLMLVSQVSLAQTIDFNEITDANDTDIGATYTSGNFRFTITNGTFFISDHGNGATKGLRPATSGAGTSLTIETIDGSEVRFESFYVNPVAIGYIEFTSIEGFKNGLSTGSNTARVTGPGKVDMAAFLADVDKVVMKSNAFIFATFDDFVFSAASETANVAPLVTAPTAPTVTEDATDVAIPDDIQLAEADLEDSHTLTFTITGGTLSLGESGITFGGSGNKSTSFTAQGSVADLNTAMDAATFTPTPNLSGRSVGDISFVANDGKADSNTISVAINIDNVNDDPSFSSTAITDLKGDKTYEYEITLTDPDNDELTLAATTKPDWLTLNSTAAGTASTLAGSGSSTILNGQGTSASFKKVYVLDASKSGVVYAIEHFDNIIRKIEPDGQVTTFAGTGNAGSQDGTGTMASFDRPKDLAVDNDGNVYVADLENNSVRKITPEGAVTTLANGFLPLYLSVDGSGNVYVLDVNRKIWKVTSSGVVSAVSYSGTYGSPTDIAVDTEGNLYLTVNGTYVIKLTKSGNEVILAGAADAGNQNGIATDARFTGLSAIDVIETGVVYVTEKSVNDYQIRKITPQGVVTTLAGKAAIGAENGTVAAAGINNPAGIGVDAQGNVYVPDENNNLIRKIAAASQTLTGNAGAEVGTHDMLLTVSDGNGGSATQSFSIFVSDVVEFDASASNGNESASTADIPVSLSKALTTEASVDYGISGTAQNGLDYTLSAGTLTFAAGDLTKNITISGIVDDTEIEPNETIILTLSNAVGIDLGNQNVHTYTINDNDPSTANAGVDQNVCGSSLNLSSNAPDAANGETGAWSIISGENGTLQNAADPNTRFSAFGGNTYTLRWTLSKGGATSSDDVQVTLNNEPIANAGPDKEIRGVGNLEGTVSLGSTGTWTIQGGDGNGVLGDPTSLTSSFTGTSGMWYTLILTASNDLCGTNTDGVDIQYFSNELPEFTSTPGTSVNDNDNYRYYPQVSDKDDAPNVTASVKPDWLTLSTLPAGALHTFAGASESGNINGYVTNARFKFPNDVAVDADGNIFVADQSNSLIRKISTGGQVSTFAGSGNQASNDGTGTTASFSGPARIAIDASGNVYVADTFNNLIRKITKEGVVTTLASGISQPYGIAVDAQGVVYVASILGNTIHKVSTGGQVTALAGSGNYGTKNGSGTEAEFSSPTGLALDATGNVYVADWGSHLIRKITPAGEVTTWAGTGTQGSTDGFGTFASFNSPKGIAIDAEGVIYVTENSVSSGRIRKIENGFVSTVSATVAPATNTLSNPEGLTFDKLGNLYIADQGNQTIKFLPAQVQPVLSGSAVGQKGTHDITLKNDDGHGGVVEQTFTITVNDATAPVFTSATTVGFAENGTGTVYTATATDANALTYSLGTGNDETLFDISAGAVTFKSSPDFESPTDANTDNAYVINLIASDGSNAANQDVTITVTNVNEAPAFVSTGVTSVDDNATYNYRVVTADPDGDALTVMATQKPDWLQLTSTPGGNVSTVAGQLNVNTVTDGTNGTFAGLRYMAVDTEGNIYATELINHVVRKVSVDGTVSTIAGVDGESGDKDGTGSEARFKNPNGIAVDAAGNVYVADHGNNKIKKITPEGVVSTFAGSGSLDSSDGTGTGAAIPIPRGMDIDAAGNLYITSVNTIRKITSAGVVSTLAGEAYSGGSRDGSLADARFGDNLEYISVDNEGNIFVLESMNKIRKISKDGVVSTLNTGDDLFVGSGLEVDDNGNVYFIEEYTVINRVSSNSDITPFAGEFGRQGTTDGDGTDPTTARFGAAFGLTFDSNGDLLFTDASTLIRKITFPSLKLSGDATGLTGTHDVTLKADDGNGETVEQNFTITINDVTDPVITSASTASFAENSTGTAYTVTATDTNGLTYSLGTDNDESLFNIDGTSGAVTFNTSPDFESPADANTDNAYVINLIASDGINVVSQNVTITVTNVNEAPSFTSTPIASVNDNTNYSYSIEVNDPEGDALTIAAATKPDWLSLSVSEEASVSTIAGSGVTDGSGTGVPKDGVGTEAGFGNPGGIATDASGNIYVLDPVANAVRKVDQNELVTTLAGNGTAEHKDGTGTNAAFLGVNDLAIDPQGNLYITSNNSIRKMTPEGVVSTFVGPSNGEAGDVEGTGAEVRFSAPVGITYDATTNALFVNDARNGKIRKVTLDGVVTTFAGSGTAASDDGSGTNASFNSPQGITVDDQGNFYIAEASSRRVRKVTPSAVVTTLAGSDDGFADGTGTEAKFGYITSLTVDSEGVVYVADGDNNSIRQISPEGVVSTLLGGEYAYVDGTFDVARLSSPQKIAIDNNENLVFNEWSRRLRRVNIDRGHRLLGSAVGQKGTFNVSLTVNDGTNDAVEQNFTITVNDATDPVFTSGAAVSFAENGTGTAYTVVATDANTLTYSLGTGLDEALFDIDGSSGEVTFKSAPDFENPSDILHPGDDAGNNVYMISINASDGINIANQVVTITVTNVDDTDPVFTSATAVDFAENGTGTAYTVVATDANTLTYSLGTGNDEALFDIAAGVVTFKTSPDFENPADGDVNNTYLINVIASDGINSVNQDVTITVTNVDDTDPIFTSATTVDFAENGTGTAYTVVATDANTVTYSLGTGNDEALFDIAAGVVTFKTSPDFENPADADANNTYVINVIASDGINSVNQDVTITVTNVDDTDPIFTSATTVDFAENGTGTAYTVVATDANTLTYSLGTGNDEALFDIAAGVVTFKISPDFENPADGDVNNTYVINVIASDGINSVNQDVTITVTNVDDTDPIFTSATTVDFAENGTGTAYTVVATDANTLTYSLGTGNDESLFDIAAGVVTFKTSPDFENPADGDANNTYVINVVASDGINSVNQDVTITVTNVDDTDPVFTSATAVDFAENGTGTAYTVAATDANALIYSLGTGNDEALFDITAGVVTFKTSPDFENPADGDANNTYVINVIASDGINTVNQDVTITVTNVDDTDPVFTSATAVDFAENGTGTAYTVVATDANALTYSLGTGNDEALFDIAVGVVTFKTSPDFENPADADANNTYVINVVASDGINSVNQDVTITVTNVDDTDPVFTSATAVDFAENGTGTAYTVAATDANALTYSLGTGNDEALFDIAVGVVTFKTSPDFENPADADANNTYVINVVASDGINSVNQDVTITVTNVDDTDPVFTSAMAVDFAENGTGTAYTVAATDANALTYSLGTGNDEALFNITAGVVTFKTSPDFENPADGDANNTYVINVIASDGINTVNQDVTITVTNVDEIAPSVSITSLASSITSGVFTVTVAYSEMVTGFVVGDIAVSNGTAGNFTSLVAGKTWTADITPASDGTVTVNVAAATATDGTGNANTAATAFSILNDETAPTVVLSSGAAIAGVYTVTAQFSETVTGFALEDVTVTDGAASDFTAVDGDTYTFSVSSTNASAAVDIAAAVTTDAAGNGNTAANQLMLSFNNAPTDINLSATSIDENNESGDLIGDFSTTDADATDSHTYALVTGASDTDNASFTIDGAGLKAASAFDFETKASYSIRVKTDDGRGGSFEKDFTISIDNVGEPKIELSGEVNFAETQLGIRVSTPITITNIGEVAVEVVIANAPADFSVTPGSVILIAGESKQVNVNFTPTREATYSGNLIFAYEGQQVSMPVSGIGAIVTGVDDTFIDSSEIKLYPNPAREILNIDLSQVNAAKLDITIVNAAGARVYGIKEYRDKQLSINVSDYNNGMYIMQFTDGKSVARKKVIIRK